MNGAPEKLTDEGSAFAAASVDITIPGYQIKHQLGSGGMASVYLAIQESFGRDVALKVLAPHHGVDSEFSQRFLREAKIISQLVHPNIVTVYDVGVYEGLHYLSMEYIRGRDLQEACGSLSKRQVINIIRDVAKALEYAHQQGYIHRDVKPENIMLHEDGRVLLMDFGIARGSDSTLGMTKTGRAIGTPYYMSPEQTKGQPVDHRSDIYSLGVVLYQMLTGYVPYDADSAIAVGIKHVSAPIPQLPDSLRFLQPIINTCLSKNPAHRYQHASELIHVLEAVPDNMLNVAEAQAAAFREAGHNHNAETLIGGDSLNTSIPEVRIPTDERKTVSATRIPPVASKPPRQRRGLLFLLLLAILVWLGFLKQEQLMGFWHNHVQPYLVQHNLLTSPAIATANPSADVTPTSPEVDDNEITAGGQYPVTTPEQIQQLRAELDEQPQNAVELAMVYRQLLQQQPRNPQARQGLAELRNWYADNIRDAFDNQDLPRARLLVAQLQESFPRIANSERFQRMEERLIQAEALQSHIHRAEDFIQAGALIQPEGSNALAEYRAAQALAPDNNKVQLGIQSIADTFRLKAKEYQANGELEQALAITSEGLNVIKDDPELLALQKQLQDDKQQLEAITAQLSEAEKQYLTGKLISPKGSSAYDHYQAVLKQDPNNATAKTGLNNIERQLISKVNFNVHNDQFKQAGSALETVRQYFGNSKAYRKAELQLALAIEATQPKVQRIIFSRTQLSSLTAPQAEKLQLGRTLYIGFDYKNFEDETTLLQAILMDGTGRVQIAEKPVIINGASGEHYFSIDLPVEGFADGSYSLQLKFENKQLNANTFIVDNQG
ncbi:MAG: protein kinase [Gammaproteobacteria bacterium]|nr:protein kinase [Gammaproteobacteria bacterium]